MALETTNYQCPSCNGPLRWDGATNALHCDYCGASFAREQIAATYDPKQTVADEKAASASTPGFSVGPDTVVTRSQAAANPIQTYLSSSEWNAAADNVVSYTCSSCGAELVADRTTAVTTCPYCDNNTVLPGVLTGMHRPDLVVPFRVTKEQAEEALRTYYQGKRFIPNAFVSNNRVAEIKGVYVPFWLYSATMDASGTFRAQNSTTINNSDGSVVLKTDHYDVKRAGHLRIERVPVDASTRMPDAHMDAIEPYDYRELKKFELSYLPGYLTERYDQDARACHDRAVTRMAESTKQALYNTVQGYDSVEPVHIDIKTSDESVAYALLPVWMLHTQWNNQDFLFAINGQTGKLIGDLPVDTGKVIRFFLLIFVILAVVFGLLAYFFLGGQQ